ncbi:MAG: diadenylate cyclase [Kiritimatiellia bacterium]
MLTNVNWGNVMNAVWTEVPDIIQIAILYFAIYSILRATRGSRVGQVLMGVGVLFAALIAFTFLFHFDVLQEILKTLLIYLSLSTVVIFQPEIRRMLATLGSLLVEDRRRTLGMGARVTPEAVVDIAFQLAHIRMGALIAFERAISLRGIEATGVTLDARISHELLVSIFTPPLPLHDGGVIVRNGRLAAAHCLFPVSGTPDELFSSGMRHRAAVGLSEETDALVLVVSEERGLVSVAHNGRLIRYPNLSDDSRKAVLRWVRKAMPQQKTMGDVFAEWIAKRRGGLFRPQRAAARRAKGDKPQKDASR